MTDYEVIRELNKIKSHSGETNDIYKRDTAIERAKAAFEKQIPRKPEPTASTIIGICPSCETTICKYNDNETRTIPYCKYCGQALDWSEQNG